MANKLKKSTIAKPAEEEKEVKTERAERKSVPRTKPAVTPFKKDKEETVDFKKLARDERTWKIVGTVSLLISIFLFIAFVSYFFTWKEDQKNVFNNGAEFLWDGDSKASNLLGRLGAYISDFFIWKGFQIPRRDAARRHVVRHCECRGPRHRVHRARPRGDPAQPGHGVGAVRELSGRSAPRRQLDDGDPAGRILRRRRRRGDHVRLVGRRARGRHIRLHRRRSRVRPLEGPRQADPAPHEHRIAALVEHARPAARRRRADVRRWTSFRPRQKQQRTLEGAPYTVVDARDPFYLERLEKFLAAVAKHFDADRPVTLHRPPRLRRVGRVALRVPLRIDRRPARRPQRRDRPLHRRVSRSPGRPELLARPRRTEGILRRADPPIRRERYPQLRRFRPLLRLRPRPHQAQRHLPPRRLRRGRPLQPAQALRSSRSPPSGPGPFMSEFCGGYGSNKVAGDKWLNFVIDDALSLHPNYVNLLGWQAGDALAFTKERPDLVAHGLRTMGYRLVPSQVRYSAAVRSGEPLAIAMKWSNEGVGRGDARCLSRAAARRPHGRRRDDSVVALGEGQVARGREVDRPRPAAGGV